MPGADGECRQDQHRDKSTTPASQQSTWSQDTLELQLFILAAVVGGLHRQHRGISSAPMLEPPAADINDSSRGCRGSTKQQQQQLHVRDCSEQVLRQLGLTNLQGKHHAEVIADKSRDIPHTLCSPIYILSFNGYDRPLDSLTTGALAISKVRLMAEVVALLPESDLAHVATMCIHRISRGWSYRSCKDPDIAEQVLTAVAENILLPLILSAGPAVLHRKDVETIRHWALAVQQFWVFVYGGIAGAYVSRQPVEWPCLPSMLSASSGIINSFSCCTRKASNC